jgi:hypothetical protein
MKKALLFSTMLLLIAAFLTANAFGDISKRPVSPSFENLVKSSPAPARSLLSPPRQMLGTPRYVPGIYPTIQAAVTAADPGDQIVVAAGTYPTAQVVIDKDLTITGAGSALTTITPSVDTGNSGDAKGWFLVDADVHFDLSGVTLDGAGKLVWQAIRYNGEGSANGVVFKNIKYNPSGPDYAGTAIAAFGTGPVNVTNCVFSQIGRVGVLYWYVAGAFSGNTYTGKGPGDWLDYALDIDTGAIVTVDNCKISGCTGVASVDGSTSAAIIPSTFYGAGTVATITHCDLTGNTGGIGVGYDASDAATVVAHYNGIYGNDYGIWSTNPTVDATNNWWGSATGPNATSNPTGTGNAVSANVTFSPWITVPNAISVVPVYTPTNCSAKKTVTFHIEQEAPAEVRGYEVQFTVNSDYARIASLSDIKEAGFLKSAATTTFYTSGGGGGGGVKAYTVSCAILGGIVGGSGSGDLFTVYLTPFAEGASSIAITSVKVRDLNNAALAASSADGSIEVDCTAPTMEAISEAQNGWYDTAPVLSNLGFHDNVCLDRAEYKIDGGGWTALFSGINTDVWNSGSWVVPGFAGLSQGSHTVYFRVKDDAGNWNGEGGSQPNLYSWQFNKDTEAPAPPTNFHALPGNQKVHLTWTNPSDPDVVGIEIRRVAWGDYPEYGTTTPPGPSAPSYPANHGEGTFVTLATGTAFDDPIAPRDIYYYAAFAKDHAGNYSALGTSATDRSTNYWLGDIDSFFDGLVNGSDLVVFSSAFGQIPGGGGWNNICDFGPTDDYSRFGIPLPDNKINFEDLMIFAMNWGKVGPLGLGTFVATHVVEDLSSLVKFDVVSIDDNTISIVLRNGAAALKGVHVVVNVSGADLQKVNRGSFFAGRSDLFYGTLPATAGDADICAAALGVGTPLVGSGEIARLIVKPTGNSSAVVTIETVDLRNVDNEKTEINAPEQHETPFVPKAAALMQNFPNPFNPVTTLTYDVAQTGNVTIQIYDVSGRLVTTLLNARVAVGRHTVEWNGKNANGSLVPSGIYFYRMKTAGYEATRKMILVR